MKVILLLIGLFFQSNEPTVEQMAFDYFVENILDKSYREKKTVFTGNTDATVGYAGPFSDCFETFEQFKDYARETKSNDHNEVKIDFLETRYLRKIKNSRRAPLNLNIQRAVRIGGYYYVHISLYKRHQFVDHYLVRILDNKVVDHCYSNEYI